MRHGYIMNLATNDGVSFNMEPKSIGENYHALWTSKPSLASSYGRLNFNSTENPTFPVTIEFDRSIFATWARQRGKYDENKLKKYMLSSKAFLISLTYPRQHQGCVLVQAPPPVLFVWPGVLRVRCIVPACEIMNEDFDQSGLLVRYTAILGLGEQRSSQIYSDKIRRVGSLRGGKGYEELS